LDLCILSGELKRERLKEYSAAPALEDIFSAFRDKMAKLVKVLKAMVDRASSTSHLPLEFAYLAGAASGTRIAPGGTGSLHHLLIKLDVGGWWTKAEERVL